MNQYEAWGRKLEKIFASKHVTMISVCGPIDNILDMALRDIEYYSRKKRRGLKDVHIKVLGEGYAVNSDITLPNGVSLVLKDFDYYCKPDEYILATESGLVSADINGKCTLIGPIPKYCLDTKYFITDLPRDAYVVGR